MESININRKQIKVTTSTMIEAQKAKITAAPDGPEKTRAIEDLAKLTDIKNSEKKARNDTIEKIGQCIWTGVKVLGGIALSLAGMSITVALTQEGYAADRDENYIVSMDTLKTLRRDAPGYITKSMKNTLL